jgi:hypothetical protein
MLTAILYSIRHATGSQWSAARIDVMWSRDNEAIVQKRRYEGLRGRLKHPFEEGLPSSGNLGTFRRGLPYDGQSENKIICQRPKGQSGGTQRSKAAPRPIRKCRRKSIVKILLDLTVLQLAGPYLQVLHIFARWRAVSIGLIYPTGAAVW